MIPFGLAPLEQNGKTKAIVDGQESELKSGYNYYTIDGLDMAAILLDSKISGDGWMIWLSGGTPAVAECKARKIKIRSLQRLAAWDRLGNPLDPCERSKGASVIAEKLIDAQERLGIKPGAGLTSAIKKIAPGIREIRRHAGANIFYKENLTRGGRNEVFRREAKEDVRLWDIRSAYAGAYKSGIPGESAGRQRKIPRGTTMFAARVSIDIPETERIPMAPVRNRNGRLIFPYGKWEGWLMGPEVLELANRGQITAVHECEVFREINPYGDMVAKLHSLRLSDRCDVARDYCKLLLVSGYGVLASHGSYPVWHLRPGTPPEGHMIRPGLIEVVEDSGETMAHGPAAAWILSSVRAKVGRALQENPMSCYCAVDSVTIPASASLPTGSDPGDWQPGKVNKGGKWFAPGTYVLNGGSVMKSSGVEKEVSEEYLGGSEVTIERTVQAAGALASGSIARSLVKLRFREEKSLSREIVPGDEYSRTRPFFYGKHDDCGLQCKRQLSKS